MQHVPFKLLCWKRPSLRRVTALNFERKKKNAYTFKKIGTQTNTNKWERERKKKSQKTPERMSGAHFASQLKLYSQRLASWLARNIFDMTDPLAAVVAITDVFFFFFLFFTWRHNPSVTTACTLMTILGGCFLFLFCFYFAESLFKRECLNFSLFFLYIACTFDCV